MGMRLSSVSGCVKGTSLCCLLICVVASACSSPQLDEVATATSLTAVADLKPVAGAWVIDSSTLPQDSVGSAGGRRVNFEATVSESGAYSVSLWVEGCSRFGGPVFNLDPITSTSTTLAGVGDCANEDLYAVGLLRLLEGARLTYEASNDNLVVQNGEISLSMSRRS